MSTESTDSGKHPALACFCLLFWHLWSFSLGISCHLKQSLQLYIHNYHTHLRLWIHAAKTACHQATRKTRQTKKNVLFLVCLFLSTCTTMFACLPAVSLMTFLVCTVLQAACRLSIISSLTRLKWMDTTRSMANSAIQGSAFYNHPGEKQFLHSQSNY